MANMDPTAEFCTVSGTSSVIFLGSRGRWPPVLCRILLKEGPPGPPPPVPPPLGGGDPRTPLGGCNDPESVILEKGEEMDRNHGHTIAIFSRKIPIGYNYRGVVPCGSLDSPVR